MTPQAAGSRIIKLREERNEQGARYLDAYVDTDGDLHLDGQDLGPATSLVSGDGEYEWFKTVAAKDVPALLGLLGARPGDGILDVLEANWSGPRSHELEKLLGESKIPVELFVY